MSIINQCNYQNPLITTTDIRMLNSMPSISIFVMNAYTYLKANLF
jgi:hypothetical protein